MQVLKTAEDCQRAVEENPDCLIAFSAKWCKPCKALKPYLEEVALTRMQVLYVDIDQVPDFADWCQVKSIPTVLVQQQGSTVNAIVGCSPRALAELVDELDPPEQVQTLATKRVKA